jgi:hypothetical protein
MARVGLPKGFLAQSELFKRILEKHTSDGAASPLLNFLLQQNIDLVADEAARLDAVAFDHAQKHLKGEKENLLQQRNLLMVPMMKRVRAYFQFLKKLFSPHTAELGTWGVQITTAGRIAYSTEFLRRKAMIEALADKHNSYPAGSSPLEGYLVQHQLSIAEDETALALAVLLHKQFQQVSKDAENATANRKLSWKPVLKHMRAIAAFLMALYNNSPKHLAAWGFEVSHVKGVRKLVTSHVKLLSQLKATSIIVGSTLTNTGKVPLEVHRGHSVSALPIILPPEGTMVIAKGFSIVTVVNSSSTTPGSFTVLRRI